MALTQTVLVWTLLGFLLIWLAIFAYLAVRPNPAQTVPFEESLV